MLNSRQEHWFTTFIDKNKKADILANKYFDKILTPVLEKLKGTSC